MVEFTTGAGSAVLDRANRWTADVACGAGSRIFTHLRFIVDMTLSNSGDFREVESVKPKGARAYMDTNPQELDWHRPSIGRKLELIYWEAR